MRLRAQWPGDTVFSGEYPPAIDNLAPFAKPDTYNNHHPTIGPFYSLQFVFQLVLKLIIAYGNETKPPKSQGAPYIAMDFAALMSKELSKSKPPAAKADDKKYLKRSEVESNRKEAYIAEQKALEEEREKKAAAKRKLEEDTLAANKVRDEKRRKLAEESRKRQDDADWEEEKERRKRLGLPEIERPQKVEVEETVAPEDDIPDDELQSKLREIGHPVILFAESHAARLRRYRKLTTVVTDGPIPTTLVLVDEKDMKVAEKVPADAAGRKFLFRQIASYFTMVLKEYEKAMDSSRTNTTESKAAYAAMVQARDNMKPVSPLSSPSNPSVWHANNIQLFRKLETGDIQDSILTPINDIVRALQERRYVDANNGYLHVSIGKAAWPIGVTMVGIHERSAREKLHDGEKGHVMGDEVTRKYLQSIKRCLTFAQVRWPPDDLKQLMG